MNDFITSLYGDCTQGVFNLWTKQDKYTYSFNVTEKKDIFNTIGELREDSDVFFEVCLQRNFAQKGKRGKEATAMAMPGLWLDIDVKTPEKPYRPDTQDEALKFVNDELPILPTMVISSGYGYHVYYLFNEPWIFKNDDERDQAKNLNIKLHKYVNQINGRSWKFDNVTDLARVLRVPDTLNFKKDTPAKVKVVHYDNNKRYTPEYLTEFLDKQGVPKDIPKEVKIKKNDNQRGNYPTAHIENIERECAWMKHCKDDAKTLPEPDWLAMLSILGRCENGHELAHQWSKSYPKYSYDETEKKLAHAMKANPRTCGSIVTDFGQYCNGCKYRGIIVSPISLGHKTELPDISRKFERTDLGNAERFVYLHKHEVRYVPDEKKWLAWDGNIWKYNYDVHDKAKHTIRSIRDGLNSNDEDMKELIAHSYKSSSGSTIDGMIRFVKRENDIHITQDDLDTNDWLLACRNGTIDLKKGKLRPSRRRNMITKMIPVTYDPVAKCPRFQQFLWEITSGNQELIDFLQVIIGYSLTGSIKSQCLFFLYGSGENGKSTFLEVLRKMMGPYSKHSHVSTFIEQKNEKIREDIARLKDARFVTTSEMKGHKQMDEEMIKDLTGGEPLTARYLYQRSSSSFHPKFKLFMLGNHKLRVKGATHGTWRRIHLIPFNVRIRPDQKDYDLTEKLLRELPGILNWAIEGCLKWQREGVNPPAIVSEATAKYRLEEDVIGQYLMERVIENHGSWITKADLFSDYANWCKNSGLRYETKISFGKRLKSIGYKEGKSSKGHYWEDIAFQAGFTVST